jgi:hypothetical protein
MGIDGCGARTIPEFTQPASLYPQVGEIGGDESGARAKIDAVSGSPLSVENLPMIHTALGMTLSHPVGSP